MERAAWGWRPCRLACWAGLVPVQARSSGQERYVSQLLTACHRWLRRLWLLRGCVPVRLRAVAAKWAVAVAASGDGSETV